MLTWMIGGSGADAGHSMHSMAPANSGESSSQRRLRSASCGKSENQSLSSSNVATRPTTNLRVTKTNHQNSEAKVRSVENERIKNLQVQELTKESDLNAHFSRKTSTEREAHAMLIREQMKQDFDMILEQKESELRDAKHTARQLSSAQHYQKQELNRPAWTNDTAEKTIAGLRSELATAQESFKQCQADLWRLQPLPQVTDTEILRDFDELCHNTLS